MYAVLHQPVIDLIGVRKVINGSAVDILAIDPGFVVKNCVEANVFEPGDLLDVAQIAAIAFAQTQDRSSRSETCAPRSAGKDESPRRDRQPSPENSEIATKWVAWRTTAQAKGRQKQSG